MEKIGILKFLFYKIPKTWVGKCLPCLPSSAHPGIDAYIFLLLLKIKRVTLISGIMRINQYQKNTNQILFKIFIHTYNKKKNLHLNCGDYGSKKTYKAKELMHIIILDGVFQPHMTNSCQKSPT